MSSKKIFLSGLVTKLENLFVFGKIYEKSAQTDDLKKKWLTDLTSARTLKVCFSTKATIHSPAAGLGPANIIMTHQNINQIMFQVRTRVF